MDCYNSRCIQTGYCHCGDGLAEASAGLMGLAFAALIGIVAGFLYPAIKIW